MSDRERVCQSAREAAGVAFDAGVRGVLRCVYANVPLRHAGIGQALTADEQEAVRYLRQLVWGRDAYDYKPRRKRPAMYRKLHTITKRAAKKRASGGTNA